MRHRFWRRLGWGAIITLTAACQAPNQQQRLPTMVAASQSFGVPTQGLCHGFPRVDLRNVHTSVDCVALIDSELIFPRAVIVRDSSVFVVDKGAPLFDRTSGTGQGRVLQYKPNAQGQYHRKIIAEGLSHPSGLTIDDQGRVYVSTTNQVLRINSRDKLEVVVDNLPTHGWHYLTAVHVNDSTLFVTVPSATDHCEGSSFPCPEVAESTPAEKATAVIRRYSISADGSVSKSFKIIARGLRDALAIGTHPISGSLYAADNGWDHVNLTQTDQEPSETPNDELNLISENTQSHYGWPYCYGSAQLSPPYADQNINCSNYRNPVQLLPPHSAPLGLEISEDKLWLNLHGFWPTGSRTSFFDLNLEGRPQGPLTTLIHWDFQHRVGYSRGRPFGIDHVEASRLYITDDWNHVLMVVYLKPS